MTIERLTEYYSTGFRRFGITLETFNSSPRYLRAYGRVICENGQQPNSVTLAGQSSGSSVILNGGYVKEYA
jgi:hypothetical protein